MDNETIVKINEKKKSVLDRLYKLSYFFSNEMLKYIGEKEEFERKCKEAEEKGEQVVIVSTSENNKKCMQNCLKATNEVIDYLRKKENAEYLEIWQLDGVNAMLDICKVEIPYDLPYALQGALGMWETIEKNLNK